MNMSDHMQYWKIVWKPWQREVKTLADVPDGVRCIVNKDGFQQVMYRLGNNTYYCSTNNECDRPSVQGVLWPLIQVIDPIPATPLPETLSDVPELRLVTLNTEHGLYFHTGGVVYCRYGSPEIGDDASIVVTTTVETVTDWVAELVTVKEGDA